MKRSIPKKTEYFCDWCRRFHPRERIAAVTWMRGGAQARYKCIACKDKMDKDNPDKRSSQ